MAIDLLNHKLDRAFDHIDAGGAGSVEREDLLGLGARVLVGFGESPTSVTGSGLVDGFDAIWAALADALGRDRESRLSREDFREGMRGAFVSGDRYEPVFRPATVAVAALCDPDGDGLVGRREFRTMLGAFGTAYDDVDVAFDRLDRTGRGTLTVDELVAAARQYYTGEDPGAAGNWLFGPL
ncbi:EF-hand domain-containing protein [Nonomuraea sp. 3-1Str]|uniref:EF-hand domain-containing protein n=1 Tax=unclassified Nonomuraea TaxID=2593643 RepID=UPI0028644911|nr:EF-hand domain-containing protein [Nonomuraea sp. 3-1Str]MDR8413940.1 EF-hand domain-containing protein [Nonomuraea sp. 3-1Str]